MRAAVENEISVQIGQKKREKVREERVR